MKKQLIIKLLLVILIFITCSISGQRRGRWYQIQKNDVKTSFVDTTTIKVTDDQISVWVLDIYNEPFDIENSADKAKRSRTQYLFNTSENNYTVIGNLYYDEIGKIISQNYNPIIGGSGRTFYEPVYDNEDIAVIYDQVTDLLGIVTKSGERTNPEQSDSASIAQRIENLQNSMQDSTELVDKPPESVIPSDSSEDPDVVRIGQPVQTSITLRENTIGPDTDPIDLPYKTNDLPDDARVAQIYNPVSGDYIELVSTRERIVPEIVEEEQVEEPLEYDLSNEKNVTNTIFTDGRQFCFQVSSWKRKNIAENEVRRLKNKGYNAYFVEARPKNKRGIWYRVRIGYFDSQVEAMQYQRNVK